MKMRLGLLPNLCIALVLMPAPVALALPPGEAVGRIDVSRVHRALAVPAAVEGRGAVAAGNGTESGSTLESVASRAGETGRKVAMSLIGLAFAVAGVILAFRRDFKEAVGVFAVGFVSVLLATPAGLSLLRDTVTSLFGSR